MEPEVVDIKIETNLKQVQQEMRDTAKVADFMGKSFKENSTINIDWSKYDVQGISPENITKEIERLNEELQKWQNNLKGPEGADEFNLGGFTETVDTAKRKVEEITTQIEILKSYLKSTKNEAEDAGEKVVDIGKKAQISFKGGIKMLTKFTLGLIGIRTVWSVLTRASHEYLSENKEVNEQLKLSFSIIANVIGPAVKWLINVIEYGAIIIAKIVQTLTGVNVIAKVSENALKNLGKQAKKTHNALASFDTISNLAQNQDAMDSYAAMLEAFEDFEAKVGEIEKFWKDWGGWVTAAVGALSLLWGGKVLGGLAKVLGTAGVGGAVGTGLAGIASVLTWIGALGLLAIEIALIFKGIDEWLKFKKDMEEYGIWKKDQNKLNISGTQAIIDKYDELIKKEHRTLEEERYLEIIRTNLLELSKKQIQDNETEMRQLINLINSTGGWSKATREQTKVLESEIDEQTEYIKSLEKIATSTDLTDKEAQEYIETTLKSITSAENAASAIKEMGGNYEKATENIELMKDSLNTMKSKYTVDIDVDANTKKLETKTNNWFTTFTNGLANFLNPVSGILSLGHKLTGSILKFDVGTNYVPDDMLAMVHKGEMIVPAKYNPATSGIGGTNEETNALLRQLNDTLENKQFSASISAREVGETATNYINNQSRIMGRSVIN